MDDYIAARKNVFFTSPDGVLKSNRCLCQLVGYYDCECFVGATLQIDPDGNSFNSNKRKDQRVRRSAQSGFESHRPTPCQPRFG